MTDLAWMRPKLAGLCGLSIDASADMVPYYASGSDYMSVETWRPDENVAQAIRCWEVVQRKAPNGDYFCCMDIRMPIGEGWEIVMRRAQSEHDKPDVLLSLQNNLPHAICLAIAAALGWEKP